MSWISLHNHSRFSILDSTIEAKKLALKNSMVTLKQDGLLKVLECITTLEEIERVTKKE